MSGVPVSSGVAPHHKHNCIILMTCCSKEIWSYEKKNISKGLRIWYFGLKDLSVIEWSMNGYTIKSSQFAEILTAEMCISILILLLPKFIRQPLTPKLYFNPNSSELMNTSKYLTNSQHIWLALIGNFQIHNAHPTYYI